MEITQEHVESTLGDLWDIEVRTDYSGRAMYGKTCLGIVTGMSGWGLAAEIRDALEYTTWAEEEDFLDYILTHEPRTDSMGGSTIYYWPGVQVIED